ncbi:MAG: aminodeoxychorismate lyase [Thiohalobacteraceae bacterium]
MNTTCLINGEPGASIPISDRGLQYGDGLFETIAVQDGACEFWDRHMRRLLNGCDRLNIPRPSIAQLASEAAALQRNQPRTGVLKILVTRGGGGRGYRPPIPSRPTRILLAKPWPNYPAAHATQGVKLRLCDQQLSRNARLAGLKHLNRLEQVLATAEWDGSEVAEGLMLDDRRQVIEGTFTNLFLVQEDSLWTPSLDHCGVAGIMRSVVLDLARELGIPCVEQDISEAALYESQEMFLTNSLIGIWPVRALGHWHADVGPVTRRLQQALAELRGRPSKGIACD